MFGRSKRKDALDHRGEAHAPEAIVTAATEPVLPPPPPPGPPLAPPVAEPPVAAPAPSIGAPIGATETAASSDALSPADIRARTLLADSIARMELQLSQPQAPTTLPA